jgi:hypothetical protein
MGNLRASLNLREITFGHGVGPSPRPSPRNDVMEEFAMHRRGEGARGLIPLPAAEVFRRQVSLRGEAR